MNLDFPAFIESLFTHSQSCTFSNSLFIISDTDFGSEQLTIELRVLSSAYRINLKILLAWFMSLMQIKKRRGPRIDPCGTPVIIVVVFD